VRIQSKIIINIAVTVVVVIILVIAGYSGTSRLGRLQNLGNALGEDAVKVTVAANLGKMMYQIIADAEINRELDQSAKDWARAKQATAKSMDDVKKTADTPEKQRLLNDTQKAVDEVYNLYEKKMLPLMLETRDVTPAMRELDGQIDKTIKGITEPMEKFKALLVKESKDADLNFDQTKSSLRLSSLITGLVGLAAIIVMSLFTLSGVMGPLKMQLGILKDMARGNGDLTTRLDEARHDEFGELGHWFNLFIGKLHDTFGQVADTSRQVASASVQLLSTAQQIATGSQEVASQAGTLATSSEEMSATSCDIAHNCQSAAENARCASASAISGSAVVRETIEGMSRIATQVKETALTVGNLGARSEQIGAIVGTIEDIADQTNLLALNAAIEAARAGEQGRGFAVVADEVRALAERTGKATREISAMIQSIQAETKGAVASMEEGVRQVEKGTEASMKSGSALEEILEKIDQVALQINQIATAVEQQTATTSEITSNINRIVDVVHLSSLGAEDTVGAAGELSRMSEALQGVVHQFKTV
jgi:methyl-accepting chemotaxis protein